MPRPYAHGVQYEALLICTFILQILQQLPYGLLRTPLLSSLFSPALVRSRPPALHASGAARPVVDLEQSSHLEIGLQDGRHSAC